MGSLRRRRGLHRSAGGNGARSARSALRGTRPTRSRRRVCRARRMRPVRGVRRVGGTGPVRGMTGMGGMRPVRGVNGMRLVRGVYGLRRVCRVRRPARCGRRGRGERQERERDQQQQGQHRHTSTAATPAGRGRGSFGGDSRHGSNRHRRPRTHRTPPAPTAAPRPGRLYADFTWIPSGSPQPIRSSAPRHATGGVGSAARTAYCRAPRDRRHHPNRPPRGRVGGMDGFRVATRASPCAQHCRAAVGRWRSAADRPVARGAGRLLGRWTAGRSGTSGRAQLPDGKVGG